MKLPFKTMVVTVLAIGLGACASSSDQASSAGAKAKSERPWWKAAGSLRKEADFKPFVWGDVRQGKGLLGGDEDGFAIYNEKGSGSSDSDKPTKVRR